MDQAQPHPFFNHLQVDYKTQDGLNSSSSDAATSPDYSDRSVNTNDSGIESTALSSASTPQNYSSQMEHQFNQFALMQQNEMLQRYQYNQFTQQSSFPNMMPIFQTPNSQISLTQYHQQTLKSDNPTNNQTQSMPSARSYTAEDISDEQLSERVRITLGCEEMWKIFENHQTEMIITKGGRNLFPKLTFKIKGLEPSNCYLVFLYFVRVTDQKYKYCKGEWQPAGKADDLGDPDKKYPASENVSFPTGREWMQNEISFGKLKLTNNPENSNNKNAVILRSMHKYRPVLEIMRFHPDKKGFSTAIRKEIERAEFIAVTAYQNNEVTKLKIQNNPFAKGFREGGRKRSSVGNDGPPVKQQSQQQNPMPFMMNSLLNNSMNYLNNLNNLPYYNLPTIQQNPYFTFY